MVHYPEYEGQFVPEAERSGKIRHGGHPGVGSPIIGHSGIIGQPAYLGPSHIAQPNVVQQLVGQPLGGPSFVGQPIGARTILGQPGQSGIKEDRYMLKKLEKDIKNLESSIKKKDRK